MHDLRVLVNQALKVKVKDAIAALQHACTALYTLPANTAFNW